MKKRGLGLSAKGIWLGGKNGQRVQAEATGCGCREVRGSADAQEIPVLEGRDPGPYSLVLSPLCSLCLHPHKGCHCPNQCFWDCLQLGLFPPLRSCELDGRMRLRPPVLSCPVLSCPCSVELAARAEGLGNRGGMLLPYAELSGACPREDPNLGRMRLGSFRPRSQGSIPPPFPGKQRIHTDWSLTLTLCFGSRWVLFIVLWPARWPLLAQDLLPASLGRPPHSRPESSV